jgi:hypothetical protein
MTAFSRPTALEKGVIVVYNYYRKLENKIIFQYNPDNLTRTLRAQTTGSENAARGEALRITAPPQESIRVSVEIDAADQLEQAQFPATSLGIHPTLASLEMLLYPKSAKVIADELLLGLGNREVIPPEAPLTLFVWGAKRILPVRITSLSITEEAFDAALNPIRAKVGFDLQVLNYYDLGLPSAGGALYMAYQIAKEVMATIGGVGNLASASPTSSFSL